MSFEKDAFKFWQENRLTILGGEKRNKEVKGGIRR